jgi:hypothetical protein
MQGAMGSVGNLYDILPTTYGGGQTPIQELVSQLGPSMTIQALQGAINPSAGLSSALANALKTSLSGISGMPNFGTGGANAQFAPVAALQAPQLNLPSLAYLQSLLIPPMTPQQIYNMSSPVSKEIGNDLMGYIPFGSIIQNALGQHGEAAPPGPVSSGMGGGTPTGGVFDSSILASLAPLTAGIGQSAESAGLGLGSTYNQQLQNYSTMFLNNYLLPYLNLINQNKMDAYNQYANYYYGLNSQEQLANQNFAQQQAMGKENAYLGALGANQQGALQAALAGLQGDQSVLGSLLGMASKPDTWTALGATPGSLGSMMPGFGYGGASGGSSGGAGGGGAAGGSPDMTAPTLINQGDPFSRNTTASQLRAQQAAALPPGSPGSSYNQGTPYNTLQSQINGATSYGMPGGLTPYTSSVIGG